MKIAFEIVILSQREQGAASDSTNAAERPGWRGQDFSKKRKTIQYIKSLNRLSVCVSFQVFFSFFQISQSVKVWHKVSRTLENDLSLENLRKRPNLRPRKNLTRYPNTGKKNRVSSTALKFDIKRFFTLLNATLLSVF